MAESDGGERWRETAAESDGGQRRRRTMAGSGAHDLLSTSVAAAKVGRMKGVKVGTAAAAG